MIKTQGEQLSELKELLAELIEHLSERDHGDGNAPGHWHVKPGIWDRDNGELAGKPCAWCETWAKAKKYRHDIKQSRLITFKYTNHKGETTQRTVLPVEIIFGSTDYHPEPQWLLHAFCDERKQHRYFSMRDIHGILEQED